MTALLIRGGLVVDAEWTRRADVLVENGVIRRVEADISGADVDRVVDAGGAMVMPGGIDPHTHLDYPFMATRTADDFYSGTAAALAGGTTTILDFIIPETSQPLLDAYEVWRSRAADATCDYGFHMAITRWDKTMPDTMQKLVEEKGVTSFKHFMAYKGTIMVADDVLFRSFEVAGKLGALCMVHAENGDLVAHLQATLLASGDTGPDAHPRSRPPELEGEAANRAIRIAQLAGAELYIVHNSCSQALAAVAQARDEGFLVHAEVLVPHLVIDDRVYRSPDWAFAAAHVMSPPFRSAGHQQALWNGVTSGLVQTTGTDHAGFRSEDRELGRGDFTAIPNGTSSIEDRMHILWHHGVNQGRISPSDFVRLTATAAAKVFGLYPRKGAILPGSDADIVIWDPGAERRISAKTHHQRIDFNLFEGTVTRGRNVVTISNGSVVFEDGKLQVEAGRGRFLKRSAASRPRRVAEPEEGRLPHA
jgi:dihydropyrimidinase